MPKKKIQQYWFDEVELDDVIKEYHIQKDNQKLYVEVSKILTKSKKLFKNGFSHFTRESIDRNIRLTIDKYNFV